MKKQKSPPHSKKMAKSHPILKFSGTLSKKTANKMLILINTNKHSKDLSIFHLHKTTF
jgi:hypothetical protein